MINPNYLGAYMSMIFPMVFVRYLYSRTARETIVWIIVLLVVFAGFKSYQYWGICAAGLALVVFVLTRKDFKHYYKNYYRSGSAVISSLRFRCLLRGGIRTRLSTFLQMKGKQF